MTRPQTTQESLRKVVTQTVNLRWDEFAKDHPQLAAAIDRVQLVESVVERLADDPEYQQALRGIDTDQTDLSRVSGIIKLVAGVVGRIL